MVHADNQYDPALVAEMAAPILAGEADIVIGSRLLDDRAIAGGMPRWKWVGNRLLTGDREPRASASASREYHTGYRAFSADFLRSIPFLRNSDDFVFDQEIFAQMLARGARVRRDPDPDALLPRGVERRLRHQPALRAQDAVGARRATGSTAAGRCFAAPPHGSARSADSRGDPARRAGDPHRVRPRDTELHARPRRDRLRPPRGLDRAAGTGSRSSYGRPTAFRPPAYPIFVGGRLRGRRHGGQGGAGASARGSPTRSWARGSSR